MGRPVLAAIFVTAWAVLFAASGAASPSLEVSDAVGIWKRCYEPGLESVSEPDAAYLVLMPDGRFFELAEGCCREGHEPPPAPRMGSFAVSGDRVRLRYDERGRGPAVVELQVTRDREVVFFDDLYGDPARTLVLHARGEIDYGYGKAFWLEAWWKTGDERATTP